MDLTSLPDDLLDGILSRARSEEEGVIGLAALGSYARGEATSSSDLDLEAVLDREPRIGYRTWFLDDLHVSIGFDSVAAVRLHVGVPSAWSPKLAVAMPAVWVWATPGARGALGEAPDFSRPPGEPELEDFVEWTSKAQRAADSLTLRVAARGMAEEAPALLRDLNGSPQVRTRVDAVRTACAFSVAPEGWADDLPVLLGLTASSHEVVRMAVDRVGRGVLRLLRERRSTVGDGQPELTTYLLDGTLERHLGFS